MEKAEASALEASSRFEAGRATIARVAALQAALEAKKAKKAGKRQQREVAALEERETLCEANSTVYRTEREYYRDLLWKAAKPLIGLAWRRHNREVSALLGTALWESIKASMTSHSYGDNWSFGQLKQAMASLISELLDAAEETKAVEKHGFLWLVKFLKKNYQTNSDFRKLRKELNFSEK